VVDAFRKWVRLGSERKGTRRWHSSVPFFTARFSSVAVERGETKDHMAPKSKDGSSVFSYECGQRKERERERKEPTSGNWVGGTNFC